MGKQVFIIVVVCLFGFVLIGNTRMPESVLLNKADFNDGGFANWESFTTSNGSLGGGDFPRISVFETTGQGHFSPSVEFKVGKTRYSANDEPPQGGGFLTRIVTEPGNMELSAHVAVTYHSPKDKRNLAGGLFEWVVDDQVVANWEVGPIENDAVIRKHFQGHYRVSSGTHSIRFRITRPFTSGEGQQAPVQIVDDLIIQFSTHR